MDSLITVVDTTRAAVVAVAETLRTSVTVVDTVRTTVTAGAGQGVPEAWTLLVAGILAWADRGVRAIKKIPSFAADGLLVGVGLLLYIVGFEGQIQWSRGFLIGGALWLASINGLGSLFVRAGVAPRQNTL